LEIYPRRGYVLRWWSSVTPSYFLQTTLYHSPGYIV
jgi:hypothetical protein